MECMGKQPDGGRFTRIVERDGNIQASITESYGKAECLHVKTETLDTLPFENILRRITFETLVTTLGIGKIRQYNRPDNGIKYQAGKMADIDVRQEFRS